MEDTHAFVAMQVGQNVRQKLPITVLLDQRCADLQRASVPDLLVEAAAAPDPSMSNGGNDFCQVGRFVSRHAHSCRVLLGVIVRRSS